MAWIELHQTVWSHRKTLLLANALDIAPIYAAAHMIHLWTWALDNASDGELTGLPHRVIAAGAGWTGDADQFVEAVLQSGYLECETLALHDWWEYAGRLMEQRKLQAERAQRKRQLYDDTGLTRQVRARDGDCCRYCGSAVKWHDRKSAAGGTYDHIEPEGPNNPENIVVACRGCNSKKGRRLPGEAGMQLLPIGKSAGGIMAGTNRASARNLPGIKPVSGQNPLYRTVPYLDPTEPLQQQQEQTGAREADDDSDGWPALRRWLYEHCTPDFVDIKIAHRWLPYLQQMGADAIRLACEEAAAQGKAERPAYVFAILAAWQAKGVRSVDGARQVLAEHGRQSSIAGSPRTSRGQPTGLAGLQLAYEQALREEDSG